MIFLRFLWLWCVDFFHLLLLLLKFTSHQYESSWNIIWQHIFIECPFVFRFIYLPMAKCHQHDEISKDDIEQFRIIFIISYFISINIWPKKIRIIRSTIIEMDVTKHFLFHTKMEQKLSKMKKFYLFIFQCPIHDNL